MIKAGNFFEAESPLIARHEGTYMFHAIAESRDSSEGCSIRRETMWSLHAVAGVDAGMTEVTVDGSSVILIPPDKFEVIIIITPRDASGSHLGPGRLGSFVVVSIPGVDVVGSVEDNEDGTYNVFVAWDPLVAPVPGIGISQPERPVQVVTVDSENIPPLPPLCILAEAAPPFCWPPNQRFVPIEVANIWTFDGMPATIEIISVTHNEEGLRPGKKPAFTLQGSNLMVRCERAGKGKGRVYKVDFKAVNAAGECSGEVHFCVPKSNQQGARGICPGT